MNVLASMMRSLLWIIDIPAIAGQSKEKRLSLLSATITWNKARTDKKYVESTQIII